MMSDPIADLLTRVRNALKVNKRKVSVPFSKQKLSLVKILVNKGFFKDLKVSGKLPNKMLDITLKYVNREPVITNMTRISKPGVRIYANVDQLYKHSLGRGIVILSTSKGLLEAKVAKKQNLGGEVICKIS